jgi:hypothetical protein
MLRPCEVKRNKARAIGAGELCSPSSDNLKRKMLQKSADYRSFCSPAASGSPRAKQEGSPPRPLTENGPPKGGPFSEGKLVAKKRKEGMIPVLSKMRAEKARRAFR